MMPHGDLSALKGVLEFGHVDELPVAAIKD
jgi:hypothetical protein